MSSSVQPSAAPQQAPQPAGPKALAREPQRPGSRLTWLVAAILSIAVFAALMYFRSRPRQQPAATSVIRTARVSVGSLQQTIRVAGSTSAGHYANIAGPRMLGPDTGRNQVLIKLVKNGAWVKKNDVIAEIDGQQARDHIDDVVAMVDQSKADIRKRRALQDIEEEGLRQNMRVVKANLDKSKLDLKASEIRTTIDQELLKLSAEEFEASYNEMAKDYQTNLLSNRAEMRILEIAQVRNERHLDRHKTDLVKFVMHAPMEGLAVMLPVWRGGDMGQIQEGDQVFPGQPFMRLVDPKSMQLDATVNQVASERLRIGQHCRVRFDAYPGLELPGVVHSIGALAVGGWRQNYYIRNVPLTVKLEQQHPQVIPDLSASADVVVAEQQNAVIVPLQAVFDERGKQVVYVKQAGMFTPREVHIGMTSNISGEVLSGLRAGEEIALQHPQPPQK